MGQFAGASRADGSEHEQRVDRTLEVAGVLLLRWGYRHLTVDEIARHASIGKGTVYLHWRSKDDLLATLLLRELADLYIGLAHRIDNDAREVRISRVLRATVALVAARPLLRALVGADRELLGSLLDNKVVSTQSHRLTSLPAWQEYLTALEANGLLKSDVDPSSIAYAADAVVAGCVVLGGTTSCSPDDVADVIEALASRALDSEIRNTPVQFQNAASVASQEFLRAAGRCLSPYEAALQRGSGMEGTGPPWVHSSDTAIRAVGDVG
jgi:AcrR family transcriptional regulator